MKNKKGISLIVLIVTIIVVIILAAVVILTLSKNNPIESAKEARFKEDVRTFQDELALAVSKEYADAGGHRDTKISASDFDEIKRYIPSFSEKYRDKFVIQDDELRYTKTLDEKEEIYTQSLNINKKLLLPKEYQQVEYIESTGTQYIDTNYSPRSITTFKIAFEFLNVNKSYGTIFGTRTSWDISDNYFKLLLSPSNSNGLYVQFGYQRDLNNKIIIEPLKKHECSSSVDGQKYYLNVDNDTIYSGTIVGEFNLSNTVVMFGFRENGIVTLDESCPMRIYYCTFELNDNRIRNFIPCYTNTTVTDINGKQCPSGTKGLYDTVEGKFYTNQGDPNKGDFIPGPDVD